MLHDDGGGGGGDGGGDGDGDGALYPVVVVFMYDGGDSALKAGDIGGGYDI